MPRASKPMLAYKGKAKLKKRVLAKIAAQREAGRIAKGPSVSTGRSTTWGAVGCLLEDPDGGHKRYESELGIPGQLAHLEDTIFESLPDELAQAWPERFMGAIGVGADLEEVWPRFAVWLMVDERWGVFGATDDEEVRAICRRVADGYTRTRDGDPPSDEEAATLAKDAWSAWEARATVATADQWAARAARATWDGRAAGAAPAAWAARNEWDQHVQASAGKLIELLEEAN